MPTVYISPDYPTVPADETSHHGITVGAETMIQLATATLHEAAVHGLRSKSLVVDFNRDTGAAHGGDVLLQDPSALTGTIRMPWTSHPIATHLAVWITYQASPWKNLPVIDLTLEVQDGGGQLDPPSGSEPAVRMSQANGSLDVSRGESVTGYSITGRVVSYPIRRAACVRVHSPVGSYPTRPRALTYGSAIGTATGVDLIVDYTNARIIRLDIVELPRVSVTV